MIIVYVETPFIVGHARHENGAQTEDLVNLARQSEVALAMPVLCLFEALYEWRGRQLELAGHQNFLSIVANELQPKLPGAKLEPEHERLLGALREAPATVNSLVAAERSSLDDAIDTLSKVSRILPFVPGHFPRARELERKGLKMADALVAAAILQDAEQTEDEKLFLVQDGDFSRPSIRDDFKRAGLTTVGPLENLLLRLRRSEGRS